MASAVGSENRIFRAEFRPDSDTEFVTVGVKHIKFWTVVGSQIDGKRAVLNAEGAPPNAKMHTMLSIAFATVSAWNNFSTRWRCAEIVYALILSSRIYR